MNSVARRALAATAAMAALTVGACGSDPPTPEEQRVSRVTERLEVTFSGQQATCIADLLDPETLTALDTDKPLANDGTPILDYTDAISVCVVDGGETSN